MLPSFSYSLFLFSSSASIKILFMLRGNVIERPLLLLMERRRVICSVLRVKTRETLLISWQSLTFRCIRNQIKDVASNTIQTFLIYYKIYVVKKIFFLSFIIVFALMQDNKTFILPVTAVASKVGINDSNI